MVNRQFSHRENTAAAASVSKSADVSKKRKSAFGKIFSAFSKSNRKTPTSGSTGTISDLVVQPRVASSPLVNSSPISSSPSPPPPQQPAPLFDLQKSGHRLRTDSKETFTTNGIGGSNVHRQQRYLLTERPEKGTQTSALPPARSTSRYATSTLTDNVCAAYPKYDGSSHAYSAKRASKFDLGRHPPAPRMMDVASTMATTTNWRAAGSAAAPSTLNAANQTTIAPHGGRMRSSSATAITAAASNNEMDILSFFDTGSIDRSCSYNCEESHEATTTTVANPSTKEVLYSDREPLDNSVRSQTRQQLMLEDNQVGRTVDRAYHTNAHHTDPLDRRPFDQDTRANARGTDDCIPHQMHHAAAPFQLQTVESSADCAPGSGSGFWYCEKMEKNSSKSKRGQPQMVDDCCENFCDPKRQQLSQEQYKAHRLQQSRGGGGLFSAQISTEERRRLAKIGAIVLATAGVAALIMLLMRYRKQVVSRAGAMCDGDDARSRNSTDGDDGEDEDDGVCVYEKFDRIKCQNSNFKALMTNSEKLVEHDDKVCASQDYRKMTKRMKDASETKTQDLFCPCGDNERPNVDKKKCFGNF